MEDLGPALSLLRSSDGELWYGTAEGARRLGVEPDRTVVVEDAVSGVQAGRAGGFGLVIGVDRVNDPDALRDGGADLVVQDLGEFLKEDEHDPS